MTIDETQKECLLVFHNENEFAKVTFSWWTISAITNFIMGLFYAVMNYKV